MERKINRKEKIHKSSNLKKNRIVIYFVLFVVVIYLIYTIYLLLKQPTKTFTIENGKLYNEETNIGYVIRDEVVVKGENYKNGMEQIKSEGERVAKDENVFRYYSKNEDNLTKKISELDVKIQEAMEQNIDIFSSDIKILEKQIDEKVEEINKLTDMSKITEYKKEINELVSKKAKIAGKESAKGSYLNQLIEKRSSYENELNSGAEYIKAPKSGIISYRVDGFEDKLTTTDFSTISKNYLESLDLKTGKLVATSSECGKIIDNFTCYIATISTSEKAKEAKIGDDVKVRLPNNTEILSEITYISKENEDEVLIILKIDNQVGELINYRKLSFDLIWWSYSGLKVPNQSIVNVDGLNYIVRSRAGYLSKVLVKVEKQNDKYSIVTNYDTDELKELGYTNKEINSLKKISLYDEVLLNPNLDKLE